MSTPSNPWCSSSSLSKARRPSSRSASAVLKGTSITSPIATHARLYTWRQRGRGRFRRAALSPVQRRWRRRDLGDNVAVRMPQQTLYDEIPYTSFPHSPSHPDQLATVAFLHGLEPPAVANCRVLELGCGAGANLLGMAYGLPGARLIGLDLAPSAIVEASSHARALGLNNVEFDVADDGYVCRAPGAQRHRVRVVQRSSRRALPSLVARAGVVAYAQRRRPGAARAAVARAV